MVSFNQARFSAYAPLRQQPAPAVAPQRFGVAKDEKPLTVKEAKAGLEAVFEEYEQWYNDSSHPDVLSHQADNRLTDEAFPRKKELILKMLKEYGDSLPRDASLDPNENIQNIYKIKQMGENILPKLKASLTRLPTLYHCDEQEVTKLLIPEEIYSKAIALVLAYGIEAASQLSGPFRS